MQIIKIRLKCLAGEIIAACLLSSALVHADGSSPIGRWKAFDEDTGEPKAIIKIQQRGGAMYGWVDKILGAPKHVRPVRCTECAGELKGAPVVGLKIIQDMQPEEGEWRGHIMDPQTAEVYNATMSVIEKGRKLEVRGYIGIPLLGRTQTWERVQ